MLKILLRLQLDPLLSGRHLTIISYQLSLPFREEGQVQFPARPVAVNL